MTVARAVAGEPKILILDDSASALDFATEKLLRRAVSGLKETTVFTVIQRIISVIASDRNVLDSDVYRYRTPITLINVPYTGNIQYSDEYGGGIMKNNRKSPDTAKRLIKYVFRHKASLFFMLFCTALFSACTLFLPLVIGNAVDCISGADSVDFKGLTSHIIKIAALVLGAAVSQYTATALANKITFLTVGDIRLEAFRKIGTLPMKIIDSMHHGETVSKIISDATQLSDGLLVALSQFFGVVVTIIGNDCSD